MDSFQKYVDYIAIFFDFIIIHKNAVFLSEKVNIFFNSRKYLKVSMQMKYKYALAQSLLDDLFL